MLTKNISFKNFRLKGHDNRIKKILDNILIKKKDRNK